MVSTPRPVIDSVLRSVCGHTAEQLVPLSGGGMNETYRADLTDGTSVVVRIARQGVPWFIDEARLMTQARGAGVPTAEVLGLEQLDHQGELLSLSIAEFLPGRTLDELVPELTEADLERLITDAGELLARVHSITPGEQLGTSHQLRHPDEHEVARVVRIVTDTLDPAAASIIERGADLLRDELERRPSPPLRLAQGDFMPKNLVVHDGKITGVIDWEFAGLAAPAFDLARWVVSAGSPLDDRADWLHRGYARVADPDEAAADLIPAFAVDWILEMLAWRNPALPAQFRRCVDVIARYVDS